LRSCSVVCGAKRTAYVAATAGTKTKGPKSTEKSAAIAAVATTSPAHHARKAQHARPERSSFRYPPRVRLARAVLGLVVCLVTRSVLGAGVACADDPIGAEAVPAPPAGDAAPTVPGDVVASPFAEDAEPGEAARALADPFAIALRTRELDAILRADARAAESARLFGAASGYAIGALGLGAVPVLFAVDDGSGLFPILSIVTAQLGVLGLAGAIVATLAPSTEERRLARWRTLFARGARPRLEELARFEGFVVADADRAADARVLTLAQGLAGIGTGLFTGLVGLFAGRAEVTQVTLGVLGGLELLVGVLQILGALEAGTIESRPAQYESRTGIRISWSGSGLAGGF
jgi:hypothetical protein